MKNLFIVHRHSHFDSKKSKSYSLVEKIFEKEIDAYEYCVEKLTIYFKEYTVIESKKSDNEKIKLYNIFKDNNQIFSKRYTTILDNFEIFFGKPEFGLLPTHDMWYITEKEI
jgi:hypothetical protein